MNNQNRLDNLNLYLITPDYTGDLPSYLMALENSLRQGVKLVQLRSKNLPVDEYMTLAHQVIDLAHRYNAKVLLSTSLELLKETAADGIHMPSAYAAEFSSRPAPESTIISVSCHNQEQLDIANTIAADIAIICPIFKTPSSPRGIPMGWQSFATLAKQTSAKAYALGGMELDHYTQSLSHGAYGIAAKRAFWDL